MPNNNELNAAETRITARIVEEFNGLRATNVPAPEPEPEPTPVPSVSNARAVATADNLVIFSAKVTGVTGTITFRASASVFGTQAGYPVQGTVPADGNVTLQIEDYNNTDPQYWQFESGGAPTVHGTVLAKGNITQNTVPTVPEPAPNVGVDPTGGSGGALTARTFQTFRNSAGTSGQYHVYADGLNWSKPVGILIYGDGTGDYGLQNPTSTYLMAGVTGLVAIAKKHNLVLLTPIPPGGKCNSASGTCWYQDSTAVTQSAKIKWYADLIQSVYGQYNIDKSRVALGGYSSGAEAISYWLLPTYGNDFMSDGVVLNISYGGAGSWIRPTWDADFKSNVHLVWDVGLNDPSLSSVRSGHAWYKSQGFTTELIEVAGVGHSRGNGEFGRIMDREIGHHIRTV